MSIETTITSLNAHVAQLEAAMSDSPDQELVSQVSELRSQVGEAAVAAAGLQVTVRKLLGSASALGEKLITQGGFTSNPPLDSSRVLEELRLASAELCTALQPETAENASIGACDSTGSPLSLADMSGKVTEEPLTLEKKAAAPQSDAISPTRVGMSTEEIAQLVALHPELRGPFPPPGPAGSSNQAQPQLQERQHPIPSDHTERLFPYANRAPPAATSAAVPRDNMRDIMGGE